MRVLHGPVNVGNQPWVLSRAERALGLKSDVVVSYGTWLEYPADRVLTATPNGGRRNVLARVRFGLQAAFQYDVLHYYFGQSYIYKPGVIHRYNFADLKLARRLGRKVFMTLQGCDVRRAGASNGRNAITMCKSDGCSAYPVCLAQLDATRKFLSEEILPLCDRVFYLNPELGHDAGTGTFIPYASCDIDAIAVAQPVVRKRPVVLHAPSNRAIKGSDMIEAALERLSARFDFDYRPVTGLAHRDAMELYRDADLVIDQVLAGWYGGFAVEVMAMGKPVAAYIRDEDMAFVPPGMASELPILRIDPRTLDADLTRIFEQRASWSQTGARSRTFVERWHNPATVARAFQRCYTDPKAAFDLQLGD